MEPEKSNKVTETSKSAPAEPATTEFSKTEPKKSKGRGCIIIAIVVILIAIILGVVGVLACTKIFTGDDTDKKIASETKLSDEELNKYDGKVLDISSKDKKVSGTVALTKNDKGYLYAKFRIFVNDKIPANHDDKKCHILDSSCRETDIAYYYVGILQNSDKEREISGQLSAINCIKENKNLDPFDDYSPTCLEYEANTIKGIESTKFEMGVGTTFGSIEDIFDISTIELHDASQAFEEECTKSGNETQCNSGVNTEEGEKGKILKVYEIKLSD